MMLLKPDIVLARIKIYVFFYLQTKFQRTFLSMLKRKNLTREAFLRKKFDMTRELKEADFLLQNKLFLQKHSNNHSFFKINY